MYIRERLSISAWWLKFIDTSSEGPRGKSPNRALHGLNPALGTQHETGAGRRDTAIRE